MLHRLVSVILALGIGLATVGAPARAERWDEYGPDRRERWEHERWERERWERRRAFEYDRQYPRPGFYAPPPVYYAPPPRTYYPPPLYAPPGGFAVPYR